MLHSKILRAIGILAVFFLCALNARAQRVRGELRLEVHDPHGAVVSPAGELISEANGIRRTFVAGPEGRYVAQDLPFGVYRLSLQAAGFAPWRELLDLVAEQPGWVYEANGVLHPRGSEYDVQFVVDGLRLTQNRSPAFAPSFDA